MGKHKGKSTKLDKIVDTLKDTPLNDNKKLMDIFKQFTKGKMSLT